MSHTVYLGLGSNLGQKKQNILNAVKRLSYISTIQNISPLYQSKALGGKNQNNYINCVVALQTNLCPHDLLRTVKKIEKKLGRKKSYRRGPRTIDIDILLYDTTTIKDPKLTIPHRHYLHRPFVFIPLHDIIDSNSVYYKQLNKVYHEYINHHPLPNDNISLIS